MIKSARITLACGMTLGATAALAHHSTANFDSNKSVEFRAVVKKFEYTNPHSHLYLERTTANGAKEEWVIEMGSIPATRSSGISPDRLKAGDSITFRGAPDKDVNKKYALFSRVTKDDGTVFGRDRGAAPQQAAAPKGPGSKDFTGVWSQGGGGLNRSSTRAFFDPVDYEVTERGKTQLATYNEENDPVLNCEKHGLPRSIYGPYPRSITRQGDVLTLHYEFMDVDQKVHMNQKTQPTNVPRTHIGHSIGWMEGETLVVETANFAPQKWGNGRGLDSSDQKKVVQRFTMADNGNTMAVQFTVTDPVYLAKPATETYKFRYTPEYKISEFNCNVGSAKTFVEQAHIK
jgi:hypothetical protein